MTAARLVLARQNWSSRLALLPLALFAVVLSSGRAGESNSVLPRYETRAGHDPNGIGKFYLGREIARVMGHEGADWLERPAREQEERSDLLVPALKLKPGDAIADIGCGTGYHTRRLAKVVGTNGVVYAGDIQPEMLDLLTNNLAAENIRNVRPVLGTITDPKLPRASLNLILMVDVYHEFDHPYEMIAAMIPSLKPGGRISLLEISTADGWWLSAAYRFYLRSIIPIVGKMCLGDIECYRMLSAYTETFGSCRAAAPAFSQAGFEVSVRDHFYGCATSIVGRKSG